MMDQQCTGLLQHYQRISYDISKLGKPCLSLL